LGGCDAQRVAYACLTEREKRETRGFRREHFECGVRLSVRRFAKIAWRAAGVGAGLLAAALIFSAGYTFSAFQHFNTQRPSLAAQAAPACETTTARISFDPRAGEALSNERDALRHKLEAAESRVTTLQKEIEDARRDSARCGFSPDVMRMLDDANRIDR
jgi:hypothetical protein